MEGPPYTDDHLPKQLKAAAAKDLSEEPETREVVIKMFHLWMPLQTHLTRKPTEAMLVKFLRATKFKLEGTIELLENYYMLRARAPEWFENVHVANQPALINLFSDGWFVPLGHNKSGEQVLLWRFKTYQQTDFSVDDYFKAFFITLEYMLFWEETQISGIAIIIEMPKECIKSSKNFVVSPSKGRKFNMILQNAIPIRILALFYPNEEVLHHFLVDILHIYMSDDLYSKSSSYEDDMKSLQRQYMDKDVLPNEFGGTAGSLEEISQFFLQKLIDKQWDFTNLTTYKAVRTTRCAENTPDEALFQPT